MNNQDRLFQAGHYIEEEKAVKRYRIKISRRVSNQSERDQFSFGMIGDGNSKATAGERLESLIAEQDEIAVTLGLDISAVTPQSDFFADLGGASLDYFAAVAKLQEDFSMPFPQDEGKSLSTAQDFYDYIKKVQSDESV